ncbi:MAG: 2'-5' RNA ligase family protein [Ornithinimicrobium sp.]|uniref:2'-5' RNA ligase family protein n=1 Tax=Ornithinimicrobium sp. TaxID=1977084 RepID=UPI003D9AFB49
MRVFAAVLPPEPIVEHLAEFVGPRASATDLGSRSRPSGWRWSRPEAIHLTLAFVPELDLGREERVIEAGEVWAGRAQPVHLRLSGAGAFPDPGRAKVLWVGVTSASAVEGEFGCVGEADVAARLSSWAHGVRGLISHAGGRPEGRAFRPHVTVARARSSGGQDAARLLQSLDTYASPSWRADTISLIASTLGDGPGGTPRYDVLHEWRLGRGKISGRPPACPHRR